MNQSKILDFLIQNVSALDGVGTKTKKLLKKKKIEKISDLLWNLPQDFTDRSNLQTLDKLEIGKITTIVYSFIGIAFMFYMIDSIILSLISRKIKDDKAKSKSLSNGRRLKKFKKR